MASGSRAAEIADTTLALHPLPQAAQAQLRRSRLVTIEQRQAKNRRSFSEDRYPKPFRVVDVTAEVTMLQVGAARWPSRRKNLGAVR
jgi:hypothetical protein